jgi:hypothetical protein
MRRLDRLGVQRLVVSDERAVDIGDDEADGRGSGIAAHAELPMARRSQKDACGAGVKAGTNDR